MDFERVRARLQHDDFRNRFLASVGYNVTEPNDPNRGAIMRAALGGDASMRETLLIGCAEWKQLGQRLRTFLGSLRERYGFVLSPRYNNEYVDVLRALSLIDETVPKFEAGRFSETDIAPFWAAADSVGNLLHNLSLSVQFGEYVLDIDPSLIKDHSRV